MSSRAVPLWSAVLLAAAATAAFAQPEGAGTTAAVAQAAPSVPLPGESVGGMVLRMVFSLALVVGLIYVCVYLFKRFMAGRRTGSAGGGLRVLGYQFLEPRRAVYVVELADRVLVLGVGGSSVNLLTEIKEPETVERLRREFATGGIHYPFSQYLERFLQKEPKE